MTLPDTGLDAEQIPRHIAIIMDGNGRWARRRGLPRIEGHRQGDASVGEMIEACRDWGVQYLTLYIFSAENWRRSDEEVQALMLLIELVARREIDTLDRKGVRLRVQGRMDELPESLREELERDCARTRENTGLNLVLAINYGGRREIVDAARELAKRAAEGSLRPDEINEELFAGALYLPDVPDPDLLIRTGGEMRISNFLLWEVAYSELYVTPVLWPDFRRDHLAEAIREYQHRERRFGAVPGSTGARSSVFGVG
jgi:undecaprenyl diphosphate synthase